MAGMRWSVETTELTIGTSKITVLQILAPTTPRIFVSEIEVALAGVSPTDPPVLMQVVRQTSAGGGGSTRNPVKMDPGQAEAFGTTGRENVNGSTQPTDTDELYGSEIGAQGAWGIILPREKWIVVAGGGRLGIALTSSVGSVKVKARFVGEE